jgi:nitroreductase
LKEEEMDLWEALQTRTTLRSFDSRPIGDDVVRKAIRAALCAPAYNHLWEWGFLRVRDRGLREEMADVCRIEDVTDGVRLQRMFGGLPEDARRIYLRALPVQRTMLIEAPEVIVPIYRTKKRETAPLGPADMNAHAAIWMGIAYLLLSLAEDGVQGCTLVPGSTGLARQRLAVPDGWELATLLPIGYPRGRLVRNPHPADVDAFLHENRFSGFGLPTTKEPMG